MEILEFQEGASDVWYFELQCPRTGVTTPEWFIQLISSLEWIDYPCF